MFIWYKKKKNEISSKFYKLIDYLILFENFSKIFGWLFFYFILNNKFRNT